MDGTTFYLFFCTSRPMVSKQQLADINFVAIVLNRNITKMMKIIYTLQVYYLVFEIAFV